MERALKQKLTCLIIFLFFLTCITAANFNKANAAPIYGGTLKLSPNMDTAAIGFPPSHRGPIPLRQAVPALETLFRNDKSGMLVPWLATGYTEDSKAKSITLTLREGVKFHDGTDFNAEAVKWNLEQHKAAKTGGTNKFASIDIIDDYTIRINLTEWDSTLMSSFLMSLGMIISPSAYEKNGKEWCETHPVGTGPFKFSNWDKDVQCAFDKFDGYWQKGKPYLDRIEWNIIADSTTRELSFRAGEIDVIMTIPTKNIKELEREGYKVSSLQMGAGCEGLVPSSANPDSPWSNLKVRQAAQHAINNEEMVKGVYMGYAEPTNQYAFKKHWSYNPDIKGYPYNPEKAKKLLAEAGYPNGFKSTIYGVTDPVENLRFVAAQGYLAEVGIDCKLIPLARAEVNKFYAEGATWDGLIHERVSFSPDVVWMLSTMYSGGGKFYASMLAPDDYVQAIQNAVTAADFETKKKYTHEALKLMIDKYCIHIPFASRYDHAISQTYVHDHGMQDFNNMLWTPEDCWMDKH